MVLRRMWNTLYPTVQKKVMHSDTDTFSPKGEWTLAPIQSTALYTGQRTSLSNKDLIIFAEWKKKIPWATRDNLQVFWAAFGKTPPKSGALPLGEPPL